MARSSAGNGQPDKPLALEVKAEAIAAELREMERWVVWRYKWQPDAEGGGKWKKPPFYPETGRACKITDRAAGSAFDNALAAYQSGKYDGVGLVLHEDDLPAAGRRLYCLDIDDCTPAPLGWPDEAAARIVERLNSYT